MQPSCQFLLTDQVGTLRAVADTSGTIVKRIDYDSFGNIIADTNPGFSVPFGFAGGLHDRDTGLVRFGYRDYSPELGRFVSKDPLDFAGGDTNLYAYSMSDPVNFIDPLGLDFLPTDGTSTLNYQGGSLTYYDVMGNPIGRYPATSGTPGVTDPKVPWKGPIPPGDYTLNPSEISEGGFLRNLLGDWGKYRVPLHPDSGTDTLGRENFFLHGGKKPGSAGCIDVGNRDTDLFRQLLQERSPIPLTVN